MNKRISFFPLLILLGGMMVIGWTETSSAQVDRVLGQSPSSPSTQSPTTQLYDVVIASYQFAFGRRPNQGELDYWLGRSRQETVNMDILLFNHRNWLRGGNEVDETIVRSYQAILSRSPREDEISYWQSRILTEGLIYIDLTKAHQVWKRNGGT